MGLRDDVKQRRHAKIRSLLNHYNESQSDKNMRDVQLELNSVSSDSIHAGKRVQAESGISDQLDKLERLERQVRQEERDRQSKLDNLDMLDNLDELDKPNKSSKAAPRHAGHGKGTAASLDPELAWKQNPNPWATWDEDRQPAEKRSYVNSQHTDDLDPPSGGWRRLRKELAWKFAISVAIFGGIWAMFESEHPWSVKGQAFISEAMSNEIDFAAVALWYKDVFAGAPSFIPIFGGNGGDATLVDGQPKQPVVSPLEGATVVRTFADLLNGVELAGDPEAAIVAAETGRIIQVSAQKDSVIIQHANERITVYGKLASVSVSVNDWVEAGQQIGSLKPAEKDSGHSFLYFAVKQKDRYMDPLDVIPID